MWRLCLRRRCQGMGSDGPEVKAVQPSWGPSQCGDHPSPGETALVSGNRIERGLENTKGRPLTHRALRLPLAPGGWQALGEGKRVAPTRLARSVRLSVCPVHVCSMPCGVGMPGAREPSELMGTPLGVAAWVWQPAVASMAGGRGRGAHTDGEGRGSLPCRPGQAGRKVPQSLGRGCRGLGRPLPTVGWGEGWGALVLGRRAYGS